MVDIALIDFDGTIVSHEYPYIGSPMPKAFEVMRKMKAADWIMILWTCREDKYLEEAVEFCAKRNMIFDGINEVPAQYDFRTGIKRKPYATLHVDDRNLGGFPGWEHLEKYLGL